MKNTSLEQAAKSAIPNNAYGKLVAQIIITSYLETIKNDPEAMERIVKKSGLNATFVIEALKQEVNL